MIARAPCSPRCPAWEDGRRKPEPGPVLSSRKMPHVQINLPPFWKGTSLGIPELDEEGGSWSATRESGGDVFRLEIMWVPTVSKYLVRYYKNEDLEALEARTLTYPHQVLEWLQRWIAKVEASLQLE